MQRGEARAEWREARSEWRGLPRRRRRSSENEYRWFGAAGVVAAPLMQLQVSE